MSTEHNQGVGEPEHLAVRDIAGIEQPDNHVVVQRLGAYAKDGSSVSVTFVSIDGEHRRLRTRHSVRLYYVLSGVVDVQIGDAAVIEAGPDQLVVIPPGSPYSLRGSGTYLVINTPAFASGDDEYQE